MMFQQLYRTVSMAALMAGSVSLARLLAGAETQALALDFTDNRFQADTGHYGSAYVLDTGTPANNYDSHPYGKLTYTSPSAKMTLGPTGTLRFGAHNLCLRSNDVASGSSWSNISGGSATAATVTSNYATDPNGGSTASRIQISVAGSTGGDYSFRSQSMTVVNGATYESSIWLKSNTGSSQTVALYDPMSSIHTLVTVTTSWQRFATSATTAGTTGFVIFGASGATTGATTLDILAWGAHLRRTPSDSTYLACTSAARYALPFEWDSSGNNLGILVEEARTNLVTYSDDLTNAAWTKSNLTTAKTATGPDGVANSATTCTATAGNATVLQSITSGSAARVQSCWIKRRTGTGNIDMTQDNGTTWATVTVTSSWTRVSIAAATVTNPIVGLRIVTSGDAVDVMLMQQEVGSFITSVIPTLGSTVTRAADNISLATSAFPYSATVTTLFVEGSIASTAGAPMMAVISDGTTNETIQIYCIASAIFNISDGAVTQANISIAGVVANVTQKLAIAATANDVQACRSGTLGTQDTSVTMPTVTTLYVGSRNGVLQPGGYIRKLMYLPRRMSDAELQAITT